MLKKIEHDRKIHNHELSSRQYLDNHESFESALLQKHFKKYLVCFEHQNHVMLFKFCFNNDDNSLEKNINIQQAFFFFKKSQS